MVNKDIIAALSSDKDITLNEVLRRQIEVAANQFLQNELTAVLGYEPHTQIDRSKDNVNYRNGAYIRTIDTEYGEINLTIPWDRLNKFQNSLFLLSSASFNTPAASLLIREMRDPVCSVNRVRSALSCPASPRRMIRS